MKIIVCALFTIVLVTGYSQDRKKPFFISSEVGIGAGKSEFDYLVEEQAPGNELSVIAKREYSTEYLRSRLSISIGYRYRKLAFGVVGIAGTQKNNEVTSRVTRESGNRVTGDGLENWPQGKSYLGLFFEYDFEIAEDILISPRFDLMKYRLAGSQTFVRDGAHVDNTVAFNDIFTDRNSFGISARLKFFARDGQYFFAGFNYVIDSYGLSRSYIQEKFSNFSSKQSHSNIVVGYQFAL